MSCRSQDANYKRCTRCISEYPGLGIVKATVKKASISSPLLATTTVNPFVIGHDASTIRPHVYKKFTIGLFIGVAGGTQDIHIRLTVIFKGPAADVADMHPVKGIDHVSVAMLRLSE